MDLPAGLPVPCVGAIDATYIRKHCTEGLDAPMDQLAPALAPVVPSRTNSQRLDQLEQEMRQMKVTLGEVRVTQLHMCQN